jgi:ABC-type glycerol-3-phosphate transport system substrate-binding protein
VVITFPVQDKNLSMNSFYKFLLPCLALLAGACTDSTDPLPNPQEKKSVSFLHYFSGSLSSGFTELAATFNSQSTAYHLRSVSLDHEAFKSSILDTLKSGNPPDIYSYWAGARTASVTDYLEPIDDLWRQSQLDTNFSPNLVKAASEYQGKKYLLPLTQHVVGFFYNKAIFTELSLHEPSNWNEFITLCEKLKSSGITPIALGARDKWPAQFWFDYLLLRTTPYHFRAQLMKGEASYLDARVTRVFQEWASLLKQGYINANSAELAWDSGANEMVYSGKAAMTLMGTWNIGYFTNPDHLWQPEIDFGFFPFPAMDVAIAPVVLGPIDGLIIPKNAANIEGAKAVLNYLASKKPQQLISEGSGALAPNMRVPDQFYNKTQLKALAEIARSDYFAFNYDLATPPVVAAKGLNAFTEFLVFPDAYPEIQTQLAKDVEAAFKVLQ